MDLWWEFHVLIYREHMTQYLVCSQSSTHFNHDHYYHRINKKDMCPLKSHNLLRYIFKNTRKMTIPVVIVQSFSHSVVSTSLWTHGLQLSFTISWSLLKLMSIESNIMSDCVGYHPTIPSSAVSFSCLQYFPAFGSFQMSQFFVSGGQSIGASASASILPMRIFRVDFL